MDVVNMASTNKTSADTRASLDRQAWIKEGYTRLAEDGVAGVRVEALAKRLAVTKGSFYWHFRDRQDLLDAILSDWREGRIRDIRKQTRSEPGRERDGLLHLIEVYGTARNRRGIRIELAIRDWARRDEKAASIVAEVDAIRLRCAAELYLACGFSQAEAASRCMLLYAYVFGQSLMDFERVAGDISDAKAWIADRIAG